jgi:phosphopantetheinyl transferase (holo-ACP synthase)
MEMSDFLKASVYFNSLPIKDKESYYLARYMYMVRNASAREECRYAKKIKELFYKTNEKQTLLSLSDERLKLMLEKL